MPLYILLILVVGGIAGIALALHLLGKTGGEPLTADTALAGWLREFPYDPPTAIDVAQNGRAALIQLQDGVGLVWRMGADTTARHVHDAHCIPTKTGLRLKLPDASAPHLDIVLSTSERAPWHNALADQGEQT